MTVSGRLRMLRGFCRAARLAAAAPGRAAPAKGGKSTTAAKGGGGAKKLADRVCACVCVEMWVCLSVCLCCDRRATGSRLRLHPPGGQEAEDEADGRERRCVKDE